ncbi:unnamed protein product [Moneuplotes crassus]|uniref:Uncharacterized protein n=1 Tax=Euplotes crassus TaxID=5936 RepID=A0AAD1XL95_EUPCR|nr:unnamed protein product [Moneuplotes crassus]
MDHWKRACNGELYDNAVYRFVVNTVSWIIIGILLAVRIITADSSKGFSLFYYIYQTYLFASCIPFIFFISAPRYWVAIIERNRRGNGDVDCDPLLFIYFIITLFGYSGYPVFFCFKQQERKHPFCFLSFFFLPIYHACSVLVFPMIFDSDNGNLLFIFFGLLYSYLYFMFTAQAYMMYDRKLLKVVFYIHPVHWLVLVVGFPVVMIVEAIMHQIANAHNVKHQHVVTANYNHDLETQIQSIEMIINTDKVPAEQILQTFNERLGVDVPVDALPNKSEFNDQCPKCNKDVQEAQIVTINEEGRFEHTVCQ